eukprot:TRINITY_DN33309_c0_g1_i1.p1 TRINITY_DN33309_c0_g1~~TRINITY_DN33309_c0_g1_i1.p1  ORF type:complete len:1399 (-),score=245.73 TRINITY_DN33309_c0_g1_i1:350-4546(-)
MATGEDLAAELFGDDSGLEDDAGQNGERAATATSEQPPRTSVDDLAAELFGDFDEEDSPSGGSKRPAEADDEGGDAKRARMVFGSGGDEVAAENQQQRKKRKMRPDIGKFLDIEAEEAGGSGEEEEDGDLADLIDDSGVGTGDVGRAKMQQLAQKHAQELDALAGSMEARGNDRGAQRVFGSNFLDKMEEKYKQMDEAGQTGEMAEPQSPGAISQQKESGNTTFIVPDVGDPKLWCCKTFAPEKELCVALLLKAREAIEAGESVPIFSVFYSEHLRGYIYVEAFKEAEIRMFIKGIRGISPWSIRLVPAIQMPQVFMSSATDAGSKSVVQVGDWVRVRRGPYKNDLGQVDEIKDDNYVIKLKPRLNFDKTVYKPQTKSEKLARRRPVARWFNRHDAEAGGLVVNTEKRFNRDGWLTFYVVDEELYRDGYLYKSYKSSWVFRGEEVKPLEHEIQDWRSVPQPSESNRPSEDLEQDDDKKLMPPPTVVPAKSVVVQRLPLIEGDIVIVNSGDLKNLQGEVMKTITGLPTVLVKPFGHTETLGRSLDLATSRLCKYFESGDYVKVLSGEREGDTGHVLKIFLGPPNEEWGPKTMALVLSISLATEFKVRVEHLRRTVEKATPQDRVDEFFVSQLVRLEGQETGMLVRLEPNQRAWVLLKNGEKVIASFGELEPIAIPPRRVYNESVWTVDRREQKLTPGCYVKAPRGATKSAPVKAEVIYVHGTQVFLQATEGLVGERAYMVCPGAKCEFMYKPVDDKGSGKGSKGKKKEEDYSASHGKISYGIQMASETTWLTPIAKKLLTGKEEDLYEKGTTVRIVGGGYRGLRGDIRAVLGDSVRVSLMCKPKLVVVKVDDIRPDSYDAPKVTRWPNMAPGTPKITFGAPAPVSPSDSARSLPLADRQPGGDDKALDDEFREPNDEECWDSSFLVKQPVDGPSTPALANGPTAQPATPLGIKAPAAIADGGVKDAKLPRTPASLPGTPSDMLNHASTAKRTDPAGEPAVEAAPAPEPGTPLGQPPVPTTPLTVSASGGAPGTPQSTARLRGRRPALLPRSGTVTPQAEPPGAVTPQAIRGHPSSTPTGHSPTSPFRLLDGRNALLESDLAPSVREPWLIVGAGVRYMRGGIDCGGFILKVYADTAQVVSESAEVGDDSEIFAMKGSETRPWKCDKRGQASMVFDGPRRGKRGKVIGFESGVAFIRTESGKDKDKHPMTLGLSGNQVLQVDAKDVARFSDEWVVAVETRTLLSNRRGGGQSSSSRGALESEPGSLCEVASNTGKEIAGAFGGEDDIEDMLKKRPWAKGKTGDIPSPFSLTPVAKADGSVKELAGTPPSAPKTPSSIRGNVTPVLPEASGEVTPVETLEEKVTGMESSVGISAAEAEAKSPIADDAPTKGLVKKNEDEES